MILTLTCSPLIECRPYNEESDICVGQEPNTKVADPDSCDGFYLCRDGEAPEFAKCPNGMWFDRISLTCDFIQNVECELESESSSTSEITSTTQTSPTTTVSTTITWSLSTTTASALTSTTTEEISTTVSESITSTIAPTTTNTAQGIPITTGTVEPGIEEKCLEFDRESVSFLASQIDCEKYYLCYMGKPVPLHCVTGQHWNQLEYFCDDPYFAHCQVSGWEDPNPYPDCPRRGKSFVPHRTDCQYYIFCNEGIGSLNRCPYYYGWDAVLKKCVLLDKARCYVHEE